MSGVKRVRIVTVPDQGDVGIVITAVELHPDWLVVNYISQATQDELASGVLDGEPTRFEVTDDLGTAYVIRGGGSSGEGGVRRMEAKLSPAVPPAATRILVSVAPGTVVIELPADRNS